MDEIGILRNRLFELYFEIEMALVRNKNDIEKREEELIKLKTEVKKIKKQIAKYMLEQKKEEDVYGKHKRK